MKILRKKTAICIVLVMVIVFASGCQLSDLADQAADLIYKEDENVLMVKNGYPSKYPDITFNQAFSSFFGSPTWKYFVGTQQGPDDDGDGNPDYTKDNLDVVEFSGYCMYMNTEVKAKIQFVLDKTQGTFETSYLSFNDVPQSKLILVSLVQKAFESYK